MHLSSRLLVLSSLKILFIALFLLQLRALHSPGYPPLDTLPRIGLNISLQGFIYDSVDSTGLHCALSWCGHLLMLRLIATWSWEILPP